MAEIVDFNEQYFKSLLVKYPHLSSLVYDDNYLYCNNDAMDLGDFQFGWINEKFFNMQPESLFIFIKYGFYKQDITEYGMLVDHVFALFQKTTLDDADKSLLINYSVDFSYRSRLFLSEEVISSDQNFVSEFIYRRQVMEKAQTINCPASFVLLEAYNNALAVDMNNQNQSQSNAQENSNSLGKGLALVRTKAGVPKLLDENVEYKIAGFTNIVLILGITVIAGMLLAIILI